MAETSQTPPEVTPPPPSRRRLFRRAAIVTVLVALAAGAGFKAFAHGGLHGHHGGLMDADPAKLDAHLDRILDHVTGDIQASEAQKAQLAAIVKPAARDLMALRAQLADGHRRAAELLGQPTVDRAQMETVRAEHLRLLDEASRRLTGALADAADVLTPEQRRRLADHIGRWRGHRG